MPGEKVHFYIYGVKVDSFPEKTFSNKKVYLDVLLSYNIILRKNILQESLVCQKYFGCCKSTAISLWFCRFFFLTMLYYYDSGLPKWKWTGIAQIIKTLLKMGEKKGKNKDEEKKSMVAI